ncbi:MAG: hypothetical protein A3E80_01085 [Chlamydiae bacterium RIFCSPHIGHO2_12_FULL_49_9]|nr:MAG: hypothetical protein A3E80_01085 [Chlamydiae bacterium RIFCSPHIGHO2_12_FULL_49_9]
MQLSFYSESQAFFDIFSHSEWVRCSQSRLFCLKDFLKKVALLPFSLLFKVCKTFFRMVGVVMAAALLFISLGATESGRVFFMERVSSLSKDLADWVLFPLAIFSCCFRLALAFIIHPSLYFR